MSATTVGELIKYFNDSIEESRITLDTPIHIVDTDGFDTVAIWGVGDYEIENHKAVRLYASYRENYFEEKNED